MNTKIIFCHIPKTGGYSFLNWFQKGLQIYEYNDQAKTEPLEDQIQKYRESSIVEIHGGCPQSVAHLRNAVPTTNELFISIIRNPIEQFESLCQDAYAHKAYLDLPLVSRGFLSNDLESIYKQEYDDFNFNIHEIFKVYYEYWTAIKSSSLMAEDKKMLEWLNSHANKDLIFPFYPQYLFRRNSQSKYLVQVLGKSFIENAFLQESNSILLTTEQLENQFIWLLLNNPIFKPLTIFADYTGIQDCRNKRNTQATRKNVTPKIADKNILKLNTHDSICLQF